MKSKFFIVFKNNLLNNYKLKSTSKKKSIFIFLLFIYVVVILWVSFKSTFTSMFDTLQSVNLSIYYIPFIFALASVFSFLFTIFSAKSGLFENKDNDLLFSLPIERSTVLLSRYILIAIYNFLISLLIIVPGIYVYITNVNVTAIFYVLIFFIVLLISIIPTILASLFAYLIAYISSKARNKSNIELICYIVFIAAYLGIFYSANKILNVLINNISLTNFLLKTVFLPIYLINKCIINNSILYLLLIIILNVGLLVLFILFLNKSYYRIISKLSSQKTKTNFVLKDSEVSIKSIKKALRTKELKKYFSSAIYVFNTIFGVPFFVILSIVSLFYSQSNLALMLSNYGLSSTSWLILYFMLFVIAFTDTTNSSISIEKNNIWILKMLPISVKDIFDAKLYVNKIILIPAVIFGLIMFRISGYISSIELIVFTILSIVLNSLIANYGLICNLAFPKLDAPNDTVIVKQSMASMLGILVPFAIIGGVIGVLFSSDTNLMIFSISAIIVSLILYLITNRIINTWGIKKFRAIS